MKPYVVASFSGGKDSTAMVLRMLEIGEQLDEVLFCDTYMEFPEPYNAPPMVTVCLRTDVGTTDADFGRLTLAVASVSKIGVLIRAYNAASTARAFSASWIAIGDMTPGRPVSADGVMVLDMGRLDEAILGGAYGELLLDMGRLDEAILG